MALFEVASYATWLAIIGLFGGTVAGALISSRAWWSSITGGLLLLLCGFGVWQLTELGETTRQAEVANLNNTIDSQASKIATLEEQLSLGFERNLAATSGLFKIMENQANRQRVHNARMDCALGSGAANEYLDRGMLIGLAANGMILPGSCIGGVYFPPYYYTHMGNDEWSDRAQTA